MLSCDLFYVLGECDGRLLHHGRGNVCGRCIGVCTPRAIRGMVRDRRRDNRSRHRHLARKYFSRARPADVVPPRAAAQEGRGLSGWCDGAGGHDVYWRGPRITHRTTSVVGMVYPVWSDTADLGTVE